MLKSKNELMGPNANLNNSILEIRSGYKTKRWSIKATIINARSERSYWVTDGARDFVKNRRFIKPSYRSTGSTING